MADTTVATAAPAPASPAPASTPAPSAPASTPSTSTTQSRPKTFAEQFERQPLTDGEAGVPSTPASPAPPPEGQAPIAPAAATETAPAFDPNRPGPKLGEHKKILENTRTKTRDDTLKAVVKEYGEHIKLGEAFATQPIEASVHIVSNLLSDPTHGPALKTALLRTLGVSAQPAAEPTLPQMDVVDAQGQPIGWSADHARKLVEYGIQQAKALVAQDLAPLKQDYESRVEAEKAQQVQAHMRQQARAGAQERYEALKALPFFEDARPQMAPLLKQGLRAELAYAQVLAKSILPKLQAKERADLAAAAQARAAAATTSPGATRPTHAARPKSFQDQDWNFLKDRSA